ncbi:MAG: sigma-70 family RNA polymerase sigma factor [Gammaproteobacteria bacterium]|nr:sigma-70 family RNA polymerase sigma factor [Gammaproteobacteria bacterium]
MINSNALWDNYKSAPTDYSKKQIFDHYHDWAILEGMRTIKSIGVKDIDDEDIKQIALLSMYEAIERFDQSYGVNFKSFARIRIKGEILNRIPSYTEDQAIFKAIKYVEAISSNDDAESELFKLIYSKIVLHTKVVLLHDYFHDQFNYFPSISSSVEEAQIKVYIDKSLKKLSDQERRVIELMFLYSQSNREVSEALNISKGRVSQLYASAMEKLENYFSYNKIML